MKKTIRFGTRKSALALAQTQLVLRAVQKAHPNYRLEVVPMTTTGDVNMKPFSEASDKFGIKGLFTQELEEALLDGRIDIAVHSLKDMPVRQDPRLPLIACFLREDPRDVLVLPQGESSLRGNLIGCSSSRRRLQLAQIMPEARVEPLRGNINTRLRKLDEGAFSGLVLAAAGLKRLNLQGRISRFFSDDEILPSPGQGILGCQGRAGHEYDEWLAAVFDADSSDCAAAERSFSAALGGGCAAPVGALARISGSEMLLKGFFADEGRGIALRRQIAGPRDQARKLGEQLAERVAADMQKGRD